MCLLPGYLAASLVLLCLLTTGGPNPGVQFEFAWQALLVLAVTAVFYAVSDELRSQDRSEVALSISLGTAGLVFLGTRSISVWRTDHGAVEMTVLLGIIWLGHSPTPAARFGSAAACSVCAGMQSLSDGFHEAWGNQGATLARADGVKLGLDTLRRGLMDRLGYVLLLQAVVLASMFFSRVPLRRKLLELALQFLLAAILVALAARAQA